MSKSTVALFSRDLFSFLFLLCIITVFTHFEPVLTTTEPLPTCQAGDYKYDFTDCDSFGGRWRVSVPSLPNKCLGGTPSAPIRVNKCYTSCEGGQYFNMSSLLCEACDAGHYSLGGGVIFDSFNGSNGQLPNGFHIITESTKHTPELDKKCNGWFVDPVSNQLVATFLAPSSSKSGNEPPEFGSGCVSAVTYTVKVVKSGRLKFVYHYQIPDEESSTLLFTFSYRMYPNGDGNALDDESNSKIHFPTPTIEQNFDFVEVTFDRPGLYVFTWKSVLLGNMRGMFSSTRRNLGYTTGSFGTFVGNGDSDNDEKSSEASLFRNRLSSGMIRIKKIVVEGVAYASECTPCEPGHFATNSGMRECQPCPSNTAFSGFGAVKCNPCDNVTEYSSRGSTRCRKRPICGPNDFYSVPVGKCDSVTKQQKVQYKWIEPRICLDSNHLFPTQDGVINCTESVNENANQCDLGMEMRAEGTVGSFCQFCPKSYYRCEKSQTCQPCPPFTSPYYALSVFQWNNSLPAWSATRFATNLNNSSVLSEDLFADNSNYLNAFFSRQCIRTDEDTATDVEASDKRSNYYSSDSSTIASNEDAYSRLDECDGHIAWQPFADHIRTGASALLDAYLILSINVPGFRSSAGGEISFVFETNCESGDKCVLLFVETKTDESELQELAQGGSKDSTATTVTSEPRSRKKFLSQQSRNMVVQEWTQSSNGRLSFRYKIDHNISAIYSWVFKRSTSFQSYAKVYSMLLTNSLIGSAIECKPCPYQSQSTPNQCVTCPEGKYLEVANTEMNLTNVPTSPDNYHCKHCPPNHVLNTSVALPIGAQSCIACGDNMITDEHADVCFSNCTLNFGEDRYDLRELHQPLHYKGGNLFTAGGTQYLHLFKISLCGHPKKSPSLSTCLNNITSFADETSAGASSGVRSFICRSTIIPDQKEVFATQSVSLGDELIGISRESTFRNISVHEDFLASKPYHSDYHLFFSTKAATSACPAGRRMTITMRCAPEVEKTNPGKAVVSTPKSCPDGTCDGCNFHLLIETGTAAACRLCRPFSSDYDTLVGECVNGQQQVHYINPKGCVIEKTHDLLSGKTINYQIRPCSVLLPRGVQIGIAIAVALGLLLLLLVFHFWNQNRSLEYKYSKLIENTGKPGEDDLAFDNCCAEEEGEEEVDSNEGTVNSSHQLMFSDFSDKNRNIPKESRGKQGTGYHSNNRVDKKRDRVGSSREMQQLFSSNKPDQSTSLLGSSGSTGNRVDDEGYETIHLTSANNGSDQIV